MRSSMNPKVIMAAVGTTIGTAALVFGSTFAGGYVHRQAPPPSSPREDSGVIMGRDFSTLLANPSVSLRIEHKGAQVHFIWESDNSARLDEARELGEYMADMKQAFEQRGLWFEVQTNIRTAAGDHQ